MTFGDRLGLVGIILSLIALAAPYLWPDKKSVGWIALFGAVVLIAVWGWLEVGAEVPRLRTQYPIWGAVGMFLVGGCLSLALWQMLGRASPGEVGPKADSASVVNAPATPSLLFVFGAPLGDNNSASWIMMLKHFGPASAYNCNIVFYDDDRKNIEHEWLVKHPDSPYPPPDLAGESQKQIYVPEAHPEGSAGNFMWNPLDPNSQHYTVSISCRDGVFEEKWEVARVDGILRSKITIEHGAQWIKNNPNLEPVVFRYEDPEFVSTALATEAPKVAKRKIVHPGWKPRYQFSAPAAIIDPNGNVQVLSAVKLPDGSTLTDFGSWKLLTKHFGDRPEARQS